METVVELVCERCQKPFNRRLAEVNRSKRLGRKNFCTRKCQCEDNIEFIPKDKRYHPENLRIKTEDSYSDFRWYIKVTTNANKKHHENNLDLEYLRHLWESQDGTCPITGWRLVPRKHNYKEPLTIKSASLDRIDNSKGYIQGNVRFVSVMANYARNTFSDEELIEFCKAVANNC